MCCYQQFFIQMKTLKLTLNKQWFDLIEKGIKTEEYREIKIYWIKRLLEVPSMEINQIKYRAKKEYDFVQFTNGYNKLSPQVTKECLGIEVRKGKVEWGAVPDTQYFVIKLGREVGRQNC